MDNAFQVQPFGGYQRKAFLQIETAAGSQNNWWYPCRYGLFWTVPVSSICCSKLKVLLHGLQDTMEFAISDAPSRLVVGKLWIACRQLL